MKTHFLWFVCIVSAFLCAVPALAEVFMGIKPGTDIKKLKEMFQNVEIKDLNPVWLKKNERLVKLVGSGFGGDVIVKVSHYKEFLNNRYKELCIDNKKNDEDICKITYSLLSQSDDEAYNVDWVRFIPFGIVKLTTMIEKYGQPDNTEIDSQYNKQYCWDVGVCAEVSDSEFQELITVKSIVYEFTDEDYKGLPGF